MSEPTPTSMCGTITLIDEKDRVVDTKAWSGPDIEAGARPVVEEWVGTEYQIDMAVIGPNRTAPIAVSPAGRKAIIQAHVGTLEEAQDFIDLHRS